MSFNWWILTIPHACFTPFLPEGIQYIKGQLEVGESGYLHWQFVIRTKKKIRESAVVRIFGPYHCEATRSSAALDYVWKEDTKVIGTEFELGSIPFKRSSPPDWERVRQLARIGHLDEIPPDIYVRCYNQLRRIGTDNLRADPIVRECVCYWGVTGSGKSRRAWSEATMDAYPKDPNSKFWDGYNGQANVVIDEFRGGIAVNHLLRWLDRYPVLVEVKGSSVALCCRKIWFTSNIAPRDWYDNLDIATLDALLRRLRIVHFTIPITDNTTQNNVGTGT